MNEEEYRLNERQLNQLLMERDKAEGERDLYRSLLFALLGICALGVILNLLHR